MIDEQVDNRNLRPAKSCINCRYSRQINPQTTNKLWCLVVPVGWTKVRRFSVRADQVCNHHREK
jgi:hypothetical protein